MTPKKSTKSPVRKKSRKSKCPVKMVKRKNTAKLEAVVEKLSRPKPQSTASAKVKISKEDNNNDIINNNMDELVFHVSEIEVSISKNNNNDIIKESTKGVQIAKNEFDNEVPVEEEAEDNELESDEEEIDSVIKPHEEEIDSVFKPHEEEIHSVTEPPKEKEKDYVITSSKRGKEKTQQSFKCKVCDEVFPNRYYLRKHNLMTHDDSVYECRVCAFTSVEPEKLKNHILKLHVAKKEKNDAFTIEQMQEEIDTLIHKKLPRKVIMEDGVTLGRDLKTKLRYACDLCSRIYSSKFALERHVRCHTLEKPFKCEVCEFSSSYKEHLNRHMMNVHLIVHSNEPPMKYIQKKKLKEEPKEETSEKISEVKMSEESETLPTDEIISESPEEELFTKKKRRAILRKRFECAVCGLKSSHKSELTDHIRNNHPNAHIESLKNLDGSAVHLIVTATKQQRQSKKLTIECEYCSLMFHDTWKYRVHLRSHTGIKPFKCSECDLRATSKMTIRDHIHRKHPSAVNPKIYLRTIGIDGEINEIEMPVPYREFKCNICKQRMKDNYTLKIHKQKEHRNDLPFQCAICGHSEMTKACMLIHCMSLHKNNPLDKLILRNGRPMKIGPIRLPSCEICNKLFSYKSQLYYHMRQHTGERSYACEHCEYKTNVKSALHTHIESKHLSGKIDTLTQVDSSDFIEIPDADELPLPINQEAEELPSDNEMETEELPSNNEAEVEELPSDNEAEVEELPSNNEAEVKGLPSNNEAEVEELPSNNEAEVEELPSNNEAEVEELPSNDEAEVEELLSNDEAEVEMLTE